MYLFLSLFSIFLLHSLDWGGGVLLFFLLLLVQFTRQDSGPPYFPLLSFLALLLSLFFNPIPSLSLLGETLTDSDSSQLKR